MTNQVKWSVTSGPAEDVLTLEEAKAQLVVETDDDDVLIQAFIDSATEWAQEYTGVKFINQSVTYTMDCLPASNGQVELPSHNASAVTAISYVDSEDATQSDVLSDYYIDTQSMSVRVKPISGWPSIRTTGYNNFTVVVTEGFGSASSDVPKPIKQAISMMVAHFYRNREAVVVGTIASDMPLSSKALLDKYRVLYRKDYGDM